ncbi:MAG: lamin tail domain-containing protein, partial [Bacteroidetes bacterium]|nr:lamin tail domain-containing protein [Bacteroidota bacterium]
RSDGGYALELINPLTPCTGQNNWMASQDNGGGTPGIQNSLFNDSPDIIPPIIIMAELDGQGELLVLFSELMDSLSLTNIGSYQIDNGITLSEVKVSSSSPESVRLVFQTPLDSGVVYRLTVKMLSDCSGNSIIKGKVDFGLGSNPGYKEVVISEIMATPEPSLGQLPEAEYIEIFNSSSKLIRLGGLTFSDAINSTSFPEITIGSGKYIIFTPTNEVSGFTSLGEVYGLSNWPTLNKTGDSLSLSLNDQGLLVDQVNYTDEWFQDPAKADGGYSLELINPLTECSDKNNWKASENSSGGTPGVQNSLFDDSPDTTPPIITNVEFTENDQLLVSFNEIMDSLSLTKKSAYQVDQGNSITNVKVTSSTPLLASLKLESPIDSGIVYTLTVKKVKDCPGNEIKSSQFKFGIGANPSFNQLIITEIMAIPEPALNQLPESEYLEIFNPTSKLINLGGLTLSDASNSTFLPDAIIEPGEYIILTPNSEMAGLTQFGTVLGITNWPSLNNTGDIISIWKGEVLIFTVNYDQDWWDEQEKTEGGYALEMIDISNPCGEDINWTASISELGGTPGQPNSVVESRPDNLGPILLEAVATGDNQLKLTFDEKLNPERINQAQIEVDNGVSVEDFLLESPQLKTIITTTQPIFQQRINYTVTVNNLSDCNLNLIRSDDNSAKFVIPEPADSADILLSEILFNPRQGGVDFVEIYNTSDKNIDLQGWQLANTDDDGLVGNQKMVSEDNLIIKPFSFMVFTTDAGILKGEYPQGDEETFVVIESLPSYPNSDGTVVLLKNSDSIADLFEYNEDFHFSLLKETKGVSLERVSYEAPTSDINNWKSAAGDVGFATPGILNSQSRVVDLSPKNITIDPKVFAPDFAGPQNFTTISYNFDDIGKVANVNVFDINGRKVKTIAQNTSLGTQGFFTWDGTNDNGQKARIGYYLVHFEIFSLNGDSKVFKETVVIGGKF